MIGINMAARRRLRVPSSGHTLIWGLASGTGLRRSGCSLTTSRRSTCMPFTFHPIPSRLPSPLLWWLRPGLQQLALWLWFWRPAVGTSGNSSEQRGRRPRHRLEEDTRAAMPLSRRCAAACVPGALIFSDHAIKRGNHESPNTGCRAGLRRHHLLTCLRCHGDGRWRRSSPSQQRAMDDPSRRIPGTDRCSAAVCGDAVVESTGPAR